MTIQEYLYRRFRKAGMTIEGACATLAQIQHESGFRPTNAEDSKGIADDVYTRQVDSGERTRHQFMYDGIGYGYAQWTFYNRKGLMYDFHRARNKSIGDSETQILFLLWEMKNYFPNQWALVSSSHDLKACTWELLDKWENPSEKDQNMINRYRDAQNFYKMFAAVTVDGTTDSTESSGLSIDDAIKMVLDQARAEIGYHEKASNAQLDDKTANAGSGNWTKYARDLDRIGNFYNTKKNGYMWCDVFVDWLFVKCFGAEIGRQMVCQPYNSCGAGCSFSADYYKQAGRWATDPQPGDQIFFTYAAGEVSHTGIVESVANGTVTTIEGNTSDQVARRSYSIGDAVIYGYGRPKWELAANGTSSNVIFDNPDPDTARILRLGVRGEDVTELQTQLLELGYDLGKWGADGDFGNDTYRAVMKFQTDYRLEPVDGEVGPVTRKAIEEALKKKKEAETVQATVAETEAESTPVQQIHLVVRHLTIEMEGPDVKLAQAALQCWGYSTIVSGIFGKEMHDKIQDFQEKHGLAANGIVDLETWRALLKLPAG